MLYMIFRDGILRSISTDKTDASVQMHAIMREGGCNAVRVVAVNGHVHDEAYDGDREED